MNKQNPTPNIPPYTWNRPMSLDWDKPYTVRYSSNLDDGPWHGMPLGGFGAGAIGRPREGILISGISTVGNTFIKICRPVNLVFLKKQKGRNKLMLYLPNYPLMVVSVLGSGIPRKKQDSILALIMLFIPEAGLFMKMYSLHN